MTLESAIGRIISPYKKQVSICLYHENDCLEQSNDTIRVPSASLIKLAVLATILDDGVPLERVVHFAPEQSVGGAGVLQLLDASEMTIGHLAALMISDSDNTASNVLIKTISMKRVNEWLIGHGYTATSIQRYLMDSTALSNGLDNWTSANEAVRLLRYLLNHFSIVRPWFANQQFRGKLPLLFDELPHRFQVYNKTGEGPKIDHDVAHFSNGETTYDVAVLTVGLPNRLVMTTLMAQIGQTIADTLMN